MKKSLFVLLVLAGLSFASCEEGTGLSPDSTIVEATLIGRWVPEGLEDFVRHEFTENTLYTIYGDGSGEFPTLEEFLEENPDIHGNPWVYDGAVVEVDLHFGNISRRIPLFKCNNYVVNWIQEADGTDGGTLYREGHSISTCH